MCPSVPTTAWTGVSVCTYWCLHVTFEPQRSRQLITLTGSSMSQTPRLLASLQALAAMRKLLSVHVLLEVAVSVRIHRNNEYKGRRKRHYPRREMQVCLAACPAGAQVGRASGACHAAVADDGGQRALLAPLSPAAAAQVA
eukprot:TRINITY_DN525_c0_g1_i1.p2 TRINITY_DN525_c0_g1~~TRINITY_DN525_c0_g1_i1.p2  ORF type:complete len:141 (+),score=11.83 TRINITY_DN525_c0_g1_i1:34-456(+)